MLTTQPKGFTHDSAANISADWWTPKWVFDELNCTFDLDPCTPLLGISWIPAKTTYSLPQNGLLLPWNGKVWLNPPYGRETGKWLAKMHDHRNGIALVFARTDVSWFHDYIAKSDAILFMRSRIKFIDGLNATKGTGAGAGSLLAAWGPDSVRALSNLTDYGYMIENT